MAPQQKQQTLFFITALDHELKRASKIKDSTLSQVRLTWWNQQLIHFFESGQNNNHPLLSDFSKNIKDSFPIKQYLFEMVELYFREVDETTLQKKRDFLFIKTLDPGREAPSIETFLNNLKDSEQSKKANKEFWKRADKNNIAPFVLLKTIQKEFQNDGRAPTSVLASLKRLWCYTKLLFKMWFR